MAYYYSDTDQYYPYQYQNQHDQYHYNHQHHHYAPPQTLAPQSYYYSDGFNYYQVINGYCFPVAYSVAGCSEPKRVEWEGGDGVNMDLIVDGEEEEEDGYDDDDFDPTPYGGGYDIVEVYGKPLPASDAICYPRSGNDSEVRAAVVVLDPASEAIVPVDESECDNDGDESESESCCSSETETSECDNGDREASGGNVIKLDGKSLIDEGTGGGGDGEEDAGLYGETEYEEVVVSDNAPSGYQLSSELPGFWDGLYGYLPCLNKKKNRTIMSGDGWVGKPDEDPWKAAADFIFGSLNPYAD